MNVTAFLKPGFAAMMWAMAALGQSGPANLAYAGQGGPMPPNGQGAPVSYASVTQLNELLGQLESTSKATQADMVKLRIERWKTDKNSKEQALSNVDSIQRNLRGALPDIIAQLRSAPEDLPASFKLYRNLDALYDVLGNVVELTGAFGSKDDEQSLGNDLKAFEDSRKQMAARIENLSASKEAEIVRLRSDLKKAQAAIPAEPPKKTVVDDTEPAKPAAKKKPAVKPKSSTPVTKAPANPNPANQSQQPQ
ncbi:MAG TPA: hypothetical protein VKV39_20525 [Candidatus Sulfotelmatobacter sp.]|nr:hypothetical protein [Candidatus Sulfotelmatobacter sp.]